MANKRILLVEDNIDVRELCVAALTANLKCEIVEAGSGDQAIAILSEDLKFDLIISDLRMPNGSGEDLYNFLNLKKISIPFTILTADRLNPKWAFHGKIRIYQKPLGQEGLVRLVRDHLPSCESQTQESFVPVAISLLKKLKTLNSGLYVKLGADKFVRVYNEGMPHTDEDFDKYAGRGADCLYVKNSDFDTFLATYRKEVFSNAAWEDLEVEEFDNSFKLNTEILRQMGKDLQVTEDLIQMTKAHIGIALKIASKNKQFAGLIEKFKKIQNLAFADHCMLTVHVAGYILNKLNPSGLTHNMRVIAFGSLIHDFALSDRAYDLMVKLGSPLKRSDLAAGTADHKEILAHPEAAEAFSKQFEFCHPEVDIVVRQHHERPDGSGFPDALDAGEIHPLSALFIVAEDFVDFFIRFFPKCDWDAYKNSRRTMFQSQAFFESFSILMMGLNQK